MSRLRRESSGAALTALLLLPGFVSSAKRGDPFVVKLTYVAKDYSRYQVHRTFGSSFEMSPDRRHTGTVVNATGTKQLALIDDAAGPEFDSEPEQELLGL